jgi:DNA-binding MarR family transcriptional regulator
MAKINFPENLRVLLYRRFKWVENYLVSQAKSSEFDYLSLSQIRVFAFMRGRELTISDLAKLMNISRQAVQKTISTLVDHGLMELTESPDNRSAKLIKISDKGRKMQLWSKQVIDNAEKELAAKIGQEKLELLKKILGEDWN